jgi:mRNA interferase RelE/StbE
MAHPQILVRRQKIDALMLNPFAAGTTKLHGHAHLYRLRVGDYRVVYEVHGDKLIVMIVRVAHRKEAYRDL